MLATAMGYRLVRGFVRLLLRLCYRRVDVGGGAERIPASGPPSIAANHHNSPADPMLIMGRFSRCITVLANAPLFRHPLIGPFLHPVGASPANRRKEADGDPRKNDAIFATAIAHRRTGGAILIVPESRTPPRPTLIAGRRALVSEATARADRAGARRA